MHINNTGGEREKYYYTDSNKPLISIIIATLNAGNHLDECLHSIFNQKYQNIEVLIFDGGSSDSTLSILEKYNREISYWQSEPDKGIYDAMNKAIKRAKGDWIYFLGADDRLLDGFSHMVSELKESNTIYYGDMSYNGAITSRKKYTAYRLSKESICHQAIIYPIQVFKHYQYNLSFPLAADWALNIYLWADKKFRFQFYPHVIADFSLTGASSIQKDHTFMNKLPTLIKEKLGWHIYLRFLLKQVKKRYKQNRLS